MKYEIKNRFTGAVQFTAEIDCDGVAPVSIKVGLAVRSAVENGADLSDADLSYANLRAADLSDANVIDGGQRADGYRFVGWIKDGALMIRAGCRNFNMEEARAHWGDGYCDAMLGAESLLILDRLEATARVRGMVPEQSEAAE